MSKLNDLIKELCPNGVEHKILADILIYEQPGNYIVHTTDYDDSFETPVLTAGKSFVLGYTNESDGVYAASADDPVIIFDDFTATFHWVDFPFKVKSSAIKMLRSYNGNVAMLRYVYYAMKCIRYVPTDHARHYISEYSNFKIPLPPLKIQQEIVKILDKFTELQAELQAELELRLKQYEHYRDELLSFDNGLTKQAGRIRQLINQLCPNGVGHKKLSEICDIKNGYTPSKSVYEYWNGDTVIPWFRMEDIRINGHVLNDSIQHVTKEAVKNGKLFPKNSIILATTATIGEHALITADSLANQQFTYLTIREPLKPLLDVKFFYYYMYVVDEWCKRNVNVSGFASVNMEGLKNCKIPLPPLEIQQEIVKILDKFSIMVSDISTGLPAEIKLRQQQYEYYRDELLSFKLANV